MTEEPTPVSDDGVSVKIYQNYYLPEQISWLDPDFIPHDWTHNPCPQFYELGVFLHFYEAGRHLATDYSGIVSWKFFEKTQVTGARFLEFIRRNPGFDVYFINPFALEGYMFYNVWSQAEAVHPGITALTQELFDRAGYTISLRDLGRNGQDTLLYCNYWVGSSTFWDAFIGFVEPLFVEITSRMSEKERSRYFEIAKYHEPVPFFPFIFERMFSTLLLVNREIRGCAFRYTMEENRQMYRVRGDWNWNIVVEPMAETIDEWDRRLAAGAIDCRSYRAFFEELVAKRRRGLRRLVELIRQCVTSPNWVLHVLPRHIRRLTQRRGGWA